MATPQLSPGIITREVDLTVGRAENVLDNVGAIAGPFPLGPVEEPITITTEQELINIFGKSISTDSQYEYWMSASSYLSYGGILKVVRCDGDSLNNGNAAVESSSTTIKIKNFDDYNQNYSDNVNFYFASKNPGSWSNNLKVCVIDDVADQILSGISTTGLTSSTSTFTPVIASRSGIIVGSANTVAISTASIALGQEVISSVANVISTGTTVIGISTGDIITLSSSSLQLGNVPSNFTFGNTTTSTTTVSAPLVVGYPITQSLSGTTSPGIGQTSTLDGYLKGIITGIGSSEILVKICSYVSGSDVETKVDYQKSGMYAFKASGTVGIITDGTNSLSSSYTSRSDWYDQQTLGLDRSVIYWKNVAPKPVTNGYSLDRNGKGDALHVVVVDDNGTISGIQGNIIEKHLFLSKATDAVSGVNSPQKVWYKNYIANNSSYIFAGTNPSMEDDSYHKTSPVSVDFDSAGEKIGEVWDKTAQGVTFNAIGNVSYNLLGGIDYSQNDGMKADLGGITTAYEIFSNVSDVNIDFLIYGPGLDTLEESQSKANKLISLAELRKDCMAVISPWSQAVLNETNAERQTENIIQFFSPLNSSSYSVFDCGYKFTYDRFNNNFRYIPCNADVAGIMARTGLNAYPWFSPAGQQRGVLNNAIKLAYNPNKSQRDELYQVRINPIINQPGIGVLLYGDRTALSYSSAFDRINVRRLFLTIEQALQKSAQAQLFEFNDQITRSNFINIVDPYLRDVQAKRGLFDFRVICDESNNTPDVIDNNEFRADIFLKPNKSINYITLTFVATRTGVSFEEVAGRV
jgi:hypothetical protein